MNKSKLVEKRRFLLLTLMLLVIIGFSFAATNGIINTPNNIVNVQAAEEEFEYGDFTFVFDNENPNYVWVKKWINKTGEPAEVDMPIICPDPVLEYNYYDVIGICENAFKDQNVVSVRIGDYIKTIGEGAFAGNPIRTVVIPGNVQNIEDNAFMDCENLGYAFIDSDYTSIGDNAFDSGVKILASDTSQAKTWANANGNAFGNSAKVIKKINISVSDYKLPKYGDYVKTPTFTISSTEPYEAASTISIQEDSYGWYDDFPNGAKYADEEIDRYGDNFSLKLSFNPSSYPAEYSFEGTSVYFNGKLVDGYDYSAANYLTAGLLFNVDEPGTIVLEKSNNDGKGNGEVSFDGVDWNAFKSQRFSSGKSVTIHAKPDDDSVFLGWIKDEEIISTDMDFTVATPDDNESYYYYACFEKKINSTGTVNDSVDFTYDEVTKTMTFIPTEDDGEGHKTGRLTGFGYYPENRSPLYYATIVEHIVIQEGITDIDEYFLYDTENIDTISIPSTVTSISKRAFQDSGIGEFTVDSSNEYFTTIDGSLFNKNQKEMIKYASKTDGADYTIPNGVVLVWSDCFDGAKLGTITLKGEDLSLSDYALSCEYKHIIISEGVKELGNYSAAPTDDPVITLPASLIYVGNQGIISGDNIQEINVSEGNEIYESIDGVLYAKNSDDTLSLYRYPSGKMDTSYTVPENVNEIKWCAINGADSLKDITISENVNIIDSSGIRYLKDATLTILNPECELSGSSIQYCTNLTMKGAKGSTAYTFAKENGINFVVVGEDLGKLEAPSNIRWDGTVVKWAPIEGARYNIKLYVNEDGLWNHATTYDTIITDGSTEYDYKERMFYKDAKYKVVITASKVGYDDSDEATSPETGGIFNRGDFDAEIDGDNIIAPFDIGKSNDYEWFEYYVSICDDEDNQLYSAWRNIESDNEYPNLREILSSQYALYGTYRIYIYKYIEYYGWTVRIGESNNYVTYTYDAIPEISKVELTIPEPVNGAPATCIEDLKLKAYCDETILDALKKSTQYYNNCYEYKADESSGWDSYGYYDSKIVNGKYQYAYYLVMEKNGGYEISDDIKIYVNGNELDPAYILDKTSDEIIIRYEFPVGTKAYDFIKNVTITGEYGKPVAGEDIKDLTDVQVTESGLSIRCAYWITKDGDVWKTDKVSGVFEANKEYGLYVEVESDSDNEFILASTPDSCSAFGDVGLISNYNSGWSAGFIKVVGKPEAVPTPTPEATPTLAPGPDDPSVTPTPGADATPIPGSSDPSANPTPAVPEVTPAKVGTTLTDTKGKAKYKVISVGKTDPADPTKDELPAVAYTGTTNKKAKKIIVSDTVTINDVTYMVESVGANALKNNKKITSVTIGKNVKVIEKNAFANCPKLKTVNCKSKVLYKIGANAFKSDKKLTKMTLKTTLLKKSNVGKNAIKGTSKKLKISVPKKVKKSYQKIFRAKGNKKVKTK
ncbi:MAG TPA: hypothetical protein DEO83_03985 [Lachnospiraceae bacterium]|nr:hypothetical protein [Lachnospiraceae bacterium]